jgi:hypothetical protein
VKNKKKYYFNVFLIKKFSINFFIIKKKEKSYFFELPANLLCKKESFAQVGQRLTILKNIAKLTLSLLTVSSLLFVCFFFFTMQNFHSIVHLQHSSYILF